MSRPNFPVVQLLVPLAAFALTTIPFLLPGLVPAWLASRRVIDFVGILACFLMLAACFAAMVFVPVAIRLRRVHPQCRRGIYTLALYGVMIGLPMLMVTCAWQFATTMAR